MQEVTLMSEVEVVEKEYSPSTMYEDYALNEYLFHWQSQNSASPESPVGLSYIKRRESGKKILLFVPEQNRDVYGIAEGEAVVGGVMILG